MKGYTMVRLDLANTAAAQAVVDANPTAYAIGTIIVSADGIANMVTSNDGTTVVLTAITNVAP
jgi:uncharacterized protein GlcG (DUF336 family)